MKSETCFEKMLGEYLPQHFTENDVKDNSEYSKIIFNHLGLYEKCTKCTAGDGTYKNAYRTQHEAWLKSIMIFEDKNINLRIYKCKYDCGWHLTKDIY